MPNNEINMDVQGQGSASVSMNPSVDDAAFVGRAEAWAVGKRNGTDVPSTDPAYHNNAKYYATEAAASAADAQQYTAAAVHTWLENNVDPETGYVLDRTLSEKLAAAPADMVGDLKSALTLVEDKAGASGDSSALSFPTSAYLKTNGNFESASNAKTTGWVDVRYFKKIRGKSGMNSSGYRYAFKNASGTILPESSAGESTVTNTAFDVSIPASAVSVCVSHIGSTAYEATLYIEEVIGSTEERVSAVEEDIAEIEDTLQRTVSKAGLAEISTDLTFSTHKYLKVNGSFSGEDNSALTTDWVSVGKYTKLRGKTALNSQGYLYAFKDASNNILQQSHAGQSSLTVETFDVNIPSTAVAVCVSNYGSTVPNATMYIPAVDGILDEEIEELKGRKHYGTFSIIGDSYSTFEGYLVDSNYPSWYPEADPTNNDVRTVDQTWWYKFANTYGCRLVENDSYSGSPISYNGYNEGPIDAKPISFITRADKLTTPELILVFGGTNDRWVATNEGTEATFRGEYKYSGWTDADLQYFRPALACLLDKLIRTQVGARIVFMLTDPNPTTTIKESVMTICEHYSIDVCELTNIALGSSHPTIAGMQTICNQIVAFMNEH